MISKGRDTGLHNRTQDCPKWLTLLHSMYVAESILNLVGCWHSLAYNTISRRHAQLWLAGNRQLRLCMHMNGDVRCRPPGVQVGFLLWREFHLQEFYSVQFTPSPRGSPLARVPLCTIYTQASAKPQGNMPLLSVYEYESSITTGHPTPLHCWRGSRSSTLISSVMQLYRYQCQPVKLYCANKGGWADTKSAARDNYQKPIKTIW